MWPSHATASTLKAIPVAGGWGKWAMVTDVHSLRSAKPTRRVRLRDSPHPNNGQPNSQGFFSSMETPSWSPSFPSSSSSSTHWYSTWISLFLSLSLSLSLCIYMSSVLTDFDALWAVEADEQSESSIKRISRKAAMQGFNLIPYHLVNDKQNSRDATFCYTLPIEASPKLFLTWALKPSSFDIVFPVVFEAFDQTLVLLWYCKILNSFRLGFLMLYGSGNFIFCYGRMVSDAVLRCSWEMIQPFYFLNLPCCKYCDSIMLRKIWCLGMDTEAFFNDKCPLSIIDDDYDPDIAIWGCILLCCNSKWVCLQVDVY